MQSQAKKMIQKQEFTETEIGKIPADWNVRKLNDLTVKIGSGATHRGGSKVYKTSGKYALIRSQNIFDDKFEYNGLAYIDEKHASELNNVILQENDILLNITGASLGRVHIVPKGILPDRVNQHVSIKRVNKKINPYFLYVYFCLPKIKHYMLGHNAGGTRDYLGIAHELKESLSEYTRSGGRGKTTFDQDDDVAVMLEKYEIVSAIFHGFDHSKFFTGTPKERMNLIQAAMEHILKQDDGKERCLRYVTELSKAFCSCRTT